MKQKNVLSRVVARLTGMPRSAGSVRCVDRCTGEFRWYDASKRQKSASGPYHECYVAKYALGILAKHK